MERDWLAERLGMGESYEAIARERGVHSSTVAYWAQKHGLESVDASRYAARGGLDEAELRRLVAEGGTTREIAAALDRSQTTVRHWLARYGLRTAGARRAPVDGEPGDAQQLRDCPRHGVSRHVLQVGGSYRCARCRTAAVAEWRRRVKRRLVDEAGGCCVICGYARDAAVLQFHHLDPATKRFTIGSRGLGRALAALRAEAAKCVLLCPTCHAEVERGLIDPHVLRCREGPDPG